MATENRTNGTAIYKDLRKIKPITIEIDEVAIYARKERVPLFLTGTNLIKYTKATHVPRFLLFEI